MNNQSEHNEEELTDHVIPSNNQSAGTESKETDDLSENWDPLQDENDVTAPDRESIGGVAPEDDDLEKDDDDLEDDGTEENEPLEEEDNAEDLDTDESTGNPAL